MKLLKPFFIISILLLSFASVNSILASNKHRSKTYSVRITNLTQGQIFSPPIAISHDSNFVLFNLGEPASDLLYPLAEGGDTSPLINAISADSAVYDYDSADGVLLPGDSVTLEIEAQGKTRYISLAGMLVSTNDAFFAASQIRVPSRGKAEVMAKAYDAGSETNSEECAYIPGPPCGNGGVRDFTDAEGYVYIHAGIHGTADLDIATKNWQNPVAKIVIEKIR